MSRTLSSYSIATFLLVLVLPAALVPAQSDPCDLPPAALLAQTDPAYADAVELAKLLEGHGFAVRCMYPTKLGSIFQVDDNGTLRSTVEGEASFVTNFGSVDVVFLPKPQTFDAFTIKEHREGSGYMYRFSGTPRVWSVNRFGTAYRVHFLKHRNHLLLVGNDSALLARLDDALQLSAH